MSFDIGYLNADNPVFNTYVLAASLMILKLMLQPWMTVVRMMKARAGFRSPEDAKKTPLNPEPREGQLDANEYVDRSRRMNLNLSLIHISEPTRPPVASRMPSSA